MWKENEWDSTKLESRNGRSRDISRWRSQTQFNQFKLFNLFSSFSNPNRKKPSDPSLIFRSKYLGFLLHTVISRFLFDLFHSLLVYFRSKMEAIEELVQLSDSMRQAAALLNDEDIDDNSSSSSKRGSTFLNVVALGNTVTFFFTWRIIIHLDLWSIILYMLS